MKPLVLMKNVLFCALPMSTLLLFGCDNGKTPAPFTPKLDDAFSVRAEMTYGDDNTAKLLLTRYGEEHWDAAFEEPASLAGVVLTIEDEAVSASYKGLSFTVPKSALPAKAMLLLLTDVLEDLSDEESLPAVANEDNTWTVSGDTDAGNYTVTFLADGTIAAFSMPNQPLEVTFTDYKTSGAPAQTDTTSNSATDDSGTTETTTTTTSTIAST